MSRFLTESFSKAHRGRAHCPTCRGLGAVWILPYAYDEWKPESWRKEHCPKCTAAQLLETLAFWRPASRESVLAA